MALAATDGLTPEDLASSLRLSDTRIEYLLDLLEERELVGSVNYVGRSSEYSLEKAGRKYVIERALVRYALENLVKGLLVARGHNATWANPLEERKPILLHEDFRHHCLPELFRTAGVKTVSKERQLLENLRVAIEAEKYPVGVRPRTRKRTLGADPAADVQGVVELFRRVEESLRQICLDGVLLPCDPATFGITSQGGSRSGKAEQPER